jgi:aquaporin related protein
MDEQSELKYSNRGSYTVAKESAAIELSQKSDYEDQSPKVSEEEFANHKAVVMSETGVDREDDTISDRFTLGGFFDAFTCDPLLGLAELKSISLYRGVLGEFLACVFFLFSVLVATSNVNNNLITIAFTFGLAIVILVQIFADISGGHINSAVTIGLVFAGRCSIARAVLYIIAQVGGSIVGVLLADWVMPENDSFSGGLGLLAPAEGVSDLAAVVLEALFTGLLVLQVLVCTDGKRSVGGASNVALSIGLTVMFAHFVLVPLDGCGINPSRATASAVVRGVYDNLWIYWVGPVIASLVVPPLYEIILRRRA